MIIQTIVLLSPQCLVFEEITVFHFPQYSETCSVLRDQCHERPPVVKDHIFPAESPACEFEPVTKHRLS